jgi:hypothetical protein
MKDMIRKMMAEGKTFEQIMKEMEAAVDAVAQENAQVEELECAREELIFALMDWLEALGIPVEEEAAEELDKAIANLEKEIKSIMTGDLAKFFAAYPAKFCGTVNLSKEPKKKTVVLNENVSPEDFLNAIKNFTAQ